MFPTYYTNSAGFTVSQHAQHGTDDDGNIVTIGAGQEFGYAHGVVDAAVAVRLAMDWQSVGTQQSEVTWTTGNLTEGTLAPAAVSNEETGEIRVPGAINPNGRVGEPNAFIDYFNEFSEEIDPDSADPSGPFTGDDPPINTRGGVITVGDIDPISPMSIEWIEVELDINGDENAFDFLRIALVSPNGTVSELNSFARPTNDPLFNDFFLPDIGIGVPFDPVGVIDPGSGGLDTVFSTNRHWGERSDEGTWTLIFENYSDAELNINSYEIAFHGIGVEDTTRVQGAVGIDGSGVDFNRETPRQAGQYAYGVTVYADLDQNGIRDVSDPFFVTGHDGNYFFDITDTLVLGTDFDIRVDGTNLPDYLDTQLSRDAAENIQNQLSIVLFPRTVPLNTFTIRGTVYADLNLSGSRDADDSLIDGATVFIDVDQNGVYTPGADPIATTSGGSYEFHLLEIDPGFYDVRVLEGSTGSFGEPVVPDDATVSFFFDPTVPDEFDPDRVLREDVDFGFTIGTGSNFTAVSGVIFNDANGSGTRESSELGLAGVATAYLDLDDSNSLTPGDIEAAPTSNGSFSFNSLLPGTYVVRIEFDQVAFSQTTPAGPLLTDGSRDDEDDFEYMLNLTAGSITSGIEFGVRSNATSDWGDLPSEFYPTTEAQNGPRHLVVGDLYLGAVVPDTELDAPGVAAPPGMDEDDTIGIDDEDGILFSTLFDTSTSITLDVTASQNGGWLQGWMDWNEDHIFQASERVFTDELLPVGLSTFVIPVPTADLTSGTVYARFRFGEQGIDSITGQAQRGEVEDYGISVVSTAIDPGLRFVHGPDFNEDGQVSGFDFLAWQRGFGTAPNASAQQGDSNSDGIVDNSDLADWEAEYGTNESQPPVAIETADFDGDGDSDGFDFLTWQLGFGKEGNATLADGDANADGNVDSADLAVWESEFGGGAGTVAAATSAQQFAPLPVEQSGSTTVDNSSMALGPQVVKSSGRFYHGFASG